jgi:hypothetical protein
MRRGWLDALEEGSGVLLLRLVEEGMRLVEEGMRIGLLLLPGC